MASVALAFELHIQDTPLQRVWLASQSDRKLHKREIDATQIDSTVGEIVGNVVSDEAPHIQTKAQRLRLCAQLLLGIARIYARKARYLHDDCNDAATSIRVHVKKTKGGLTGKGKTSLGAIDIPAEELINSLKAITLPETHDSEEYSQTWSQSRLSSSNDQPRRSINIEDSAATLAECLSQASELNGMLSDVDLADVELDLGLGDLDLSNAKNITLSQLSRATTPALSRGRSMSLTPVPEAVAPHNMPGSPTIPRFDTPCSASETCRGQEDNAVGTPSRQSLDVFRDVEPSMHSAGSGRPSYQKDAMDDELAFNPGIDASILDVPNVRIPNISALDEGPGSWDMREQEMAGGPGGTRKRRNPYIDADGVTVADSREYARWKTYLLKRMKSKECRVGPLAAFNPEQALFRSFVPTLGAMFSSSSVKERYIYGGLGNDGHLPEHLSASRAARTGEAQPGLSEASARQAGVPGPPEQTQATGLHSGIPSNVQSPLPTQESRNMAQTVASDVSELQDFGFLDIPDTPRREHVLPQRKASFPSTPTQAHVRPELPSSMDVGDDVFRDVVAPIPDPGTIIATPCRESDHSLLDLNTQENKSLLLPSPIAPHRHLLPDLSEASKKAVDYITAHMMNTGLSRVSFTDIAVPGKVRRRMAAKFFLETLVLEDRGVLVTRQTQEDLVRNTLTLEWAKKE